MYFHSQYEMSKFCKSINSCRYEPQTVVSDSLQAGWSIWIRFFTFSYHSIKNGDDTIAHHLIHQISCWRISLALLGFDFINSHGLFSSIHLFATLTSWYRSWSICVCQAYQYWYKYVISLFPITTCPIVVLVEGSDSKNVLNSWLLIAASVIVWRLIFFDKVSVLATRFHRHFFKIDSFITSNLSREKSQSFHIWISLNK